MTHPNLDGTKDLARRFRKGRRARASLSAEKFLDAEASSASYPAGIARAQWVELLDVLRNAPDAELDTLIGEWLARQSTNDADAASQTLPLESDPESTLVAPPPPAEQVKYIDRRYRIVRMLGEGAFGKVFLVKDKLQNESELALKLIKKEHTATSEALMRFKNEILLLRVLNHPGIPQIFNDGITDDGEFYYTMAYVEGRTLDDVIRKEAPLDPLRIVRITKQILDVLDYAHGRGAIHRDLKPGNIFLLHAGTAKEQVRVLDFGIAKVLSREGILEHAQTMNTEMALGTPHYMSPEQVRGGEIDGRTDLYALGVIIYQMCSGRFPFSGKTLMEILAARLEKPPSPLEDKTTPAWLRDVVMKLLERERDHRPDTQAIRVMLDNLQVTQRTMSKRLTWIGASVAVIALVLGWSVFGDKDGDSSRQQAGATPGESERGTESSKPSPGPEAAGDPKPPEDPKPQAKPLQPEAKPLEAESEQEKPAPPAKAGDTASREQKPPEPAKPAPRADFDFAELLPAQSPQPLIEPEQRTLRVSGRATRPLALVRVGEAQFQPDAKDPMHFAVDVELPPPPLDGIDADRALTIVLVERDDSTSISRAFNYRRRAARMPRDCTAAASATVDERGRVTLIVHTATQIPLALVDEGSAGPGYYLGCYEVTYDEWNRGPSKLIAATKLPAPPATVNSGRHPAAGMDFASARDFCEQLRLRLPSTAEWERAAALAGGKNYPWGDEVLDGACNSSGTDNFTQSAPAGSFELDHCGPFFDMAGNVQEFCVDAKGAAALRGGGWRTALPACKLATALTAPPRGSVSIGLRVALSLTP